jgi:transcription-repair coupling factor (superfamily II helicase)
MITLLRKHIAKYLEGRPEYQKARRDCRNTTFSVAFEGVQSGFLPFVLADLLGTGKAGFLVIVPTEREAEALRDDLETILDSVPSVLFPAWEVLPYSGVRPRAAVCSQASVSSWSALSGH